jgi:hypothetical protein
VGKAPLTAGVLGHTLDSIPNDALRKCLPKRGIRSGMGLHDFCPSSLTKPRVREELDRHLPQLGCPLGVGAQSARRGAIGVASCGRMVSRTWWIRTSEGRAKNSLTCCW